MWARLKSPFTVDWTNAWSNIAIQQHSWTENFQFNFFGFRVRFFFRSKVVLNDDRFWYMSNEHSDLKMFSFEHFSFFLVLRRLTSTIYDDFIVFTSVFLFLNEPKEVLRIRDNANFSQVGFHTYAMPWWKIILFFAE